MSKSNSSWLLGILSYILWGVLPLFWALLKSEPATGILANRVFWGAVSLIPVMLYVEHKSLVPSWKEIKLYSISAVFLSINWGIYIWSVNNNLVLASSLGYFSAPLLYFVFSYFIFNENLNLYKIISILLGLIAFILLATSADYITLLIALSLACSFVTYGAIHKKYKMPSIQSIYYEALIISPIAITYLYKQNGLNLFSSQEDLYILSLLALSGVVTVIPLLCFSSAVRSLPLYSVGILQYITPIMTFLLGVYIFNEKLEPIKLYSFIIIWIAIAVSIVGIIRNYNKKL